MDIYIISKRLFSITVIFLFLSTLFVCTSSASVTIDKHDFETELYEDNDASFDGYIIQLNEDSILRFRNTLASRCDDFCSNLNTNIKNIFLKYNVENYRTKLLSIQKQVKESILKLLGGDISSEKIFSEDFTFLFNGICIKNIPDESIDQIKSLSYVKDVVPNYRITATLDESVPLINADDIWEKTDTHGDHITGKGITVAILDTGVDYNHPDLKDNYIQDGSYDFVNKDDDPIDDHYIGHGTHCAGILCGKGNESNYRYVGVAPDAKFYAFKILDYKGDGNYSTLLAGLQAAVDPNGDLDTSDHVDIVSLSFGTETPGSPDDVICQVTEDAVDVGVIVVAAAGNSGPKICSISSPGCSKKVICVGSADKNDVIASSSSRGPVIQGGNFIIKPDVVAPGVDIISTKVNGGYQTMSGTSMATPHVAGAITLLLQAKPEYRGDYEEIKKVLQESAVDLGYGANIQGSGRIDILNTIEPSYELRIQSPSEVNEKESFEISISDKEGNPVKAIVILKVPFHIPRISFGSTVTFEAPNVFIRSRTAIIGEIIVFKLLNRDDQVKRNIIIFNKN